MKKVLIKGILFIIVMILVGIGSILGYKEMTKEEEPEYEEKVTEREDVEIYMEDVVVKEARKVGKFYGYDNEWSYEYKLEQTPEMVEEREEDNFLVSGFKKIGRAYAAKEYRVGMSHYYQLGYDLSKVEEDDFVYSEDTKELTIYLPKLELSYTPMLSESDWESDVGVYRKDFTEKERKEIMEDGIDKSIENFKETKEEEIEKGREYTKEGLKELLKRSEGIEGTVMGIRFVDEEGMDVTVEEYKKDREEEK